MARQGPSDMSITTFDRTAGINEIAAEMDRRGTVIESLEATITELQAKVAKLTKERDGLRDYAHDATKAITGLTAGGSEYFGRRIGDIYTADLPFCVERIREKIGFKIDLQHEKAVREKAESALAKSEASREAAEARVAEAAKVIAFYADEANWTEPGQANKQELFDTVMGEDLGRSARAFRDGGSR